MLPNARSIGRVVAQPRQVAFEAPLFALCLVGASELYGEKSQLNTNKSSCGVSSANRCSKLRTGETLKNMKAHHQEYYYILVYKGTKELFLFNAQLPLFWSKEVAERKTEPWKDELEIKIISHEQLFDFLM